MLPRLLREEHEKSLSPFACQSRDSRGRLEPDEPCSVRTVFERDTGRIIYSMEFRRLRHKTQVFFDPQNDHICTRMEHVIYVNYIANYNKFYGSLSVSIILLLWFYILGYAIMIGLQVNYILKRDYYGGVDYLPRLTLIQKSKYLSKWTKFTVNDEQKIN